jgi:hypothetical protein
VKGNSRAQKITNFWLSASGDFDGMVAHYFARFWMDAVYLRGWYALWLATV